MARFGAPHGVVGLIRLQIFSRQPRFFAERPHWHCRLPPAASGAVADAKDDDGAWQQLTVERCFFHGDRWLAKLAGIDDRDAALRWRHGQAALLYEDLPAPPQDEFYWCDLIGMQVQNAAGQDLGVVQELQDIGAHDLLCVSPVAPAADDKTPDAAPLLIPFVDKHILRVDAEARRISVDWEADW